MFPSDTILIFGLPIVIAIHGVTKKHRFTWEWAVVSVYVMSVLIAFINSIIFPMIFQTLSEMSGSPGLAQWLRTAATLLGGLLVFSWYDNLEKARHTADVGSQRVRAVGAFIVLVGVVAGLVIGAVAGDELPERSSWTGFILSLTVGFIMLSGTIVFAVGQ